MALQRIHISGCLSGSFPRGAAPRTCLVASPALTTHRAYHSSTRPGRGGLLPCSASLADNMLSGLKKALGKGPDASPVSYASFTDTAPSWEALSEMLRAKQAELGCEPQDLETGPTSPFALRRTFGKSEEPQVKLYRDHAAWCPYCQKVWLQLEEKQVPYIIEKVNMRCYGDKTAEFMRKVPSGLLPVMEYYGQVITESAVIARILERDFQATPLLPEEGSTERVRADVLMKLERRLFSAWLSWLCQSWSEEQHKRGFIACMDDVDREMGAAGGPFFLGPELSLVDITFAPFLERIVASIPYYKGFIVRGQGRWPNLERWFAAMEARPTYMGTKSDFYTHCHDLPPQLGGCVSVPEAAAIAAAIDGTDATSWRLPLPPLSATSLEPYAPGDNPAVDRLEAAAKLVGNHAAVTRFALRGAGRPGPRPVSAPLADPTGIADEQYTADADAALRHVAHALLVGTEEKQGSAHALQTAAQGMRGAPVAASLAYLRDRVGVPRDMKFPAARQFRAHLNWFIDSIAA